MKQLLFGIILFISFGDIFAQMQPRLVLPVGLSEGPNSASFSPNNNLVLSIGNEHDARIYDATNGKELFNFDNRRDINSAAWSPNGRLLITANSDGTARIYETENGIQIKELIGSNKSLAKVCFSPDGKYILTADYDSVVRIFNVISGQENLAICSNQTEFFRGSHTPISCFSSNSKYFLTAKNGSIVAIYNTESGDLFREIKNCSPITKAIFNPNDVDILIFGTDDTLRFWQIYSGDIVKKIKIGGSLSSVEFSKDGAKLIYASGSGTINIIDLHDYSTITVHNGDFLEYRVEVKMHPNDSLIMFNCSEGEAILYNFHTKKYDKLTDTNYLSGEDIDISSNGELGLVVVGHTIKIFDLTNLKLIQQLEGRSYAPFDAKYSLDSKHIQLNYGDDGLMEFDVLTGNSIVGDTFDTLVTSLNHGGIFGNKMLASMNGSLYIYDLQTEKKLLTLQENCNRFIRADFSCDNKLVLAVYQDTAAIYDVQSGAKIKLFTNHDSDIRNFFTSYDGKFFILSTKLNSIYIYEISSGSLIRKISSKHTDNINSLQLSTDNRLLITTSNDYTSKIFELSSGIQKLEIRSIDKLEYGAISPDEKTIVTTGNYKTTIWDAKTGKPFYTRLQLDGNDWLAYDEYYRFDGTAGAIDYLYLTCGLEVIDLAQVKDSLWVPGLVEKIMNKEPILINDRPAPKLSDLNICELTPLIEPIEKGEKGIYRYQITPRDGGLGETEVYINGNLTYTLRPNQLEHNVVNQNEIYFLTISKDSLQPFLVGDKNSANPLMIKSKVKGASIYGRGVEVEMVKETDAASPSFYGIFVGVNDYGNINKENNELRYKNLDFAKKDAEDLAAAVEITARNLFKDSCHIYKLTGIDTDSTAPTKANLQEVLSEIGQKAKSSDVLFIFFAGHGDILQVKGEKEIRFILHRADKKNLTSTSFGVDELKQWCDPKVIKAQKRVFVFDACHSGELINQTMAFNGRGDDEGLRIRQLDKLKDKNGMMILAAAADNEFAYEDETLNQGVLTYHLLEVIKSQENDTMLTVRNWFDETIEIVKEYSRINGNQQEPSSFGDGRFEIGNIDQNVRQSIQITCPKTRIGLSVFTDPTGEAKLIYPNLKSKINQHFETTSSRGSLVYSKNMDKAYRVEGSYRLEKKKIHVRYEIYLGSEQKGTAIVLDPLKGMSEDELVKEITESIQREIEIVDQRDEKCKLKS